MKTIILLFSIVILLVCPILEVEAIAKYQSTSDNSTSSESMIITKTIYEKDQQIAYLNGTISGLQSTEDLSLSVGILGAIAGIGSLIFEFKRRRTHTDLRNLISNGINKILNAINHTTNSKSVKDDKSTKQNPET